MTNGIDTVDDDELLYRRIRSIVAGQTCFRVENGRVVFTVAAFLDRHKKPSVDRAKLQGFEPHRSRQSIDDGIVELIAVRIRAIGIVHQRDSAGRVVSEHVVDVVPAPIENQPAHAEVITRPAIGGKAFERLKEALARLATEAGWRVEPGSQLLGR